MIHYDLADYLVSITAINAVISGRIYNNRAPQTTTTNKVETRVVYRLAPGSTRYYHSGGSSGLVQSDILLQMTASTTAKANQLYELIRDEIDGFSGTWSGTTIDKATLTPVADNATDPTQGDDVGYPTVTAVVEVFYQESIPALAGPPP